MILSRGACDAHEHLEQVRMVEHVADECDRASLAADAVGRVRDQSATSLLASDVVLAGQLVERLDDGNSAHAVVLGQLSLCRQVAPSGKFAALDALQQGGV